MTDYYDKPLTREMRMSRVATPLSQVEKGWWYINPDSIDVVSQGVTGGVQMVRLTRKQLERALDVMKKYTL